jgi:formylglycine-generating enzyme required for sulfatase activity
MKWAVAARGAGAILLATACELIGGLHGDRRFDASARSGDASTSSTTSNSDRALVPRTPDAAIPALDGRRGTDAATVLPRDAGVAVKRSNGSQLPAGGRAILPDAGSVGVTIAIDGGDDNVFDAGEPPPTGPSCAGMSGSDCRDESCCTSHFVPGGTFAMGRSANGKDRFPDGEGTELPEHLVTVSPFWLDKYEVTVGRFRRYVDALQSNGYPQPDAGANPHIPGSGWQPQWDQLLLAKDRLAMALNCDIDYATYTPAASNSEQLPMNCISWYEAFAFCIWDGGRLPTEAEWEFAAAGGSQNRLYPWGQDLPTRALAVIDSWGGGSPGKTEANDLKPVGDTPAGDGRWGHADLAGSLMEYGLDTWFTDFYSQPAAQGRDVASLSVDDASASRGLRIHRGGSFFSDAADARSAARGASTPEDRWYGVGVRCARNRR